MKIMIILPDLRGGGAERLHISLANYWITKGHLVEFVLMSQKGELLYLLDPKIKIIDLNAKRIRETIISVSRHIKSSQPDIILSAMWPLTSATVIAWLLAGKKGKLFLSDHVQLSISCKQELHISTLYLKVLMKMTYPFSTGIIAVSHGVKKDMCELAGFSEKKVNVIYNPAAIGISPVPEKTEIREQLWGKGFKYHILSTGTLKAQKDHETLIKAFSMLPKNLKAKLIILGEGELRNKLENLIKELDLQKNVSMPGFVTDPYPWFRSASLFVLSSRWEGFGNVIVEALECGVPIVSTDCPSGPAEILENGRYGKLVPIENADTLAIAMKESLETPQDHNFLMTRAKDFSIQNISKQYLNSFSKENK